MCCRELWTNAADVTNLGYLVILDVIENAAYVAQLVDNLNI